MPLKQEISTEYTTGGTPANRRVLRRLNPMVFLTICCILFILVIIAALLVLTFLPIYSKAQGNQVKYQVQSSVLILIYNLPDRLPMNWTYSTDKLETKKLSILQNLLQHQLNEKKITRKTSITVMDANIVRQESVSTSLPVISSLDDDDDDNNKTVITLTQPDIDTKVKSTNQLNISLMLRYALECTKRCQNNLKESIFAKTFHTLDVSIDTFQYLFANELKTPTNQFLSGKKLTVLSTAKSTTQISCIVNNPPSTRRLLLIMARNYEAESALNQLISSTIESCLVCSGGQKVSRIGYTNELIFQQITSQYGGLTTIIFYYTTDRKRFAQISVNDRSPSINVSFPTMSPNQNIALLPLMLNLCQGLNSIRISNPNGYTPDFDRIIVY